MRISLIISSVSFVSENRNFPLDGFVLKPPPDFRFNSLPGPGFCSMIYLLAKTHLPTVILVAGRRLPDCQKTVSLKKIKVFKYF